MSGFLSGVSLQWKLDMRSKSLLVACYIIPLIFFLLMGGIFSPLCPIWKAHSYNQCLS